jgi:transposase
MKKPGRPSTPPACRCTDTVRDARRDACVTLYRRGLTYRAIARRLGLGVKTAYTDVRRALADARRARGDG